MKTLRKYFLKRFFNFLFIILFSLTAISLVAEFFNNADDFFTKKPSIYFVLQYLLLQSPKFLLYVLPMASLLSTLITIGIALKWRETIAIKASGCSIRKLFSIFLIVGMLMSLFALITGETVVPEATRKALWVKNVKILKRQPKIAYREEALWLKGLDGSLIRIRDFVEDKNRILETSIFSFESFFKLKQRIEADEGEWVNGAWKLKNVIIFDFSKKTTTIRDSLFTNALEEPKIFKEEMKKPEEMNFIELHAYYSRLEKAGFKNIKYLTN